MTCISEEFTPFIGSFKWGGLSERTLSENLSFQMFRCGHQKGLFASHKTNDRTVLSVQNITELLGFCLHNTYFSFQNKFYEQVERVPMGSLVSPIVANLHMEHFERKALRSAINPPQVWYRFVDDAWVIQQQSHKQAFLDHNNSIDPTIKFTVEGIQGNGAIPFHHTLVTLLADNPLSITVYHKPTHNDQYLQWDSHHSLSAKYSVIGTLTHRAKTVCTNPELLQRELQHLRKALVRCKYPPWAINKVRSKVLNSTWEDNSINNPCNTDNNSTTSMEQDSQSGENNNEVQANNNRGVSTVPPTSSRPNSTVGYVVIPYTKGTVESFKHTCGRYGIQTYFKGNSTIKQVLMKPKDQDPKEMKNGVIYSFQYNHITCDEEYIGKTSRTLGERCKEDLKQPSPIHMHIQQTGHITIEDSFNIIGKEYQEWARTIKESIFIRVNNPTLNQNIGKYNLSHIWDRVLFNTPRLFLTA